MKTQTIRLKIIAVGPEQTSTTVKATTRKVILTVAEVSKDNPFGNAKEPSHPFEVEVYNHNIEAFNISPALIQEVADCELDIRFYKKDANSPVKHKFIVNDLSFRI